VLPAAKILLLPVLPLAVILLAGEHPGTTASIRSTLHIFDLKTGVSRTIYTANGVYEAPAWSRDGESIIFSGGPDRKLYRVRLAGGAAERIDRGDIDVNRGNGFSPDGRWWALSRGEVFLAMRDGSDFHQLTHQQSDVPFVFHGWSPDSQWLVGTRRAKNGNRDIYRVSFDGCEDLRLTSNPAADDGPDYSPDRKWIYFSSDRAGGADIWRMPISGAGDDDQFAQRITADDLEDANPHPSPDGRWLLMLSHARPATESTGLIRIAPLPGARAAIAKPRTLTQFPGNEDGMTANPWSPDSLHFAYITHQRIP
jgi:Tol biopolymer transport system component